MVNKVGLLCKGNEEMVPFAFRLYQRYLAGDIQDRVDAQGRCEEDHGDTDTGSDADPLLAGNTKVHRSHTTEVALNEITAFSQTFCRKEKAKPCDDDDGDDHDDRLHDEVDVGLHRLDARRAGHRVAAQHHRQHHHSGQQARGVAVGPARQGGAGDLGRDRVRVPRAASHPAPGPGEGAIGGIAQDDIAAGRALRAIR